jgi:putative transposase
VSKRKKHTPEQVIAKLRDADVALSQGASIAEVCKKLEVSEQTYHRWRTQFGGMKGPDMKRLKELERENGQLKKIVADLTLDVAMLKELAKGNF